MTGGALPRAGVANIRGTSQLSLSGAIKMIDVGTTTAYQQAILTVGDTATLSAAIMSVGNSGTTLAGKTQTAQYYQTGGTTSITNNIQLSVDANTGATSSNNSFLNLAGGTLRTAGKVVYSGTQAGNTNTALVNFHGGTLGYTGGRAQADFLNLTGFGSTSSGAYIYEGGTIDDGGQNVTISQALLSPNTGSGVTSIALASPNNSIYFLDPPVVRFTGGGGVGASAIVQIDTDGSATGTTGKITGIVVTNPGTGYTSAPTVNLDFGLGRNAPATTFGTASIAANAYTGGLTKKGAGTLTLAGTNTYTGDTVVQAGTLSISQAYLADGADVYLSNGTTVLDLTHSSTDTIRSLYIDGVQQAAGTWGGMGSSATHQTARISNSSGTGILNVTVGGAAVTTPDASTITGITPGSAQLSVAYTAGADGGSAITDYKVSLNSGAFMSVGSTANPLVISGLVNGTGYTVAIKAVNAAGDGAASATSAAVTPYTTPSAPTLGTITLGNAQLSVAYTAGSDGGSPLTDYKVSLNGGAFTTVGSTANPLVISGLVNGTGYTVAIKAVNAAGDGAPSGTSAAATPRTPYGFWIDGYYTGVSNPLIVGPNADPDQDGQPNFLEFALDSNPNSGSSLGKAFVKIATVGTDTNNVLTLSVAVRNTAAAFTADANNQRALDTTDSLTYLIEASTTLADWGTPVVTQVTDEADLTAIQGSLPLPDSGWSYKTFRTAGTASSSTADFIRVKVTSP